MPEAMRSEVIQFLNDQTETRISEDVKAMAKIPPQERCYCGRFLLGKCPKCPPDKTCLDRIQDLSIKRP